MKILIILWIMNLTTLESRHIRYPSGYEECLVEASDIINRGGKVAGCVRVQNVPPYIVRAPDAGNRS